MECAKCKKQALLVCSGCKECPALDGDGTTVRYCGSACQKEDWPNHKSSCLRLRDRQILYRVASTAQKLWYIHREASWHTFELTSIEKHGEMIDPRFENLVEVLILKGNARHNSTSLDEEGKFNGKDPVFLPFSDNLFQNKEDREAALSYLGCREATLWMVEFISGMLDGIVRETELVVHHTKGEKLVTKYFDLQKQPNYILKKPFHEVLKVILRSGETFAIDLAGAQYNHHEPVLPWKEFKNTRILSTVGLSASAVPRARELLKLDRYNFEIIDHFWAQMSVSKGSGKLGIDGLLELSNVMILWFQMDHFSLKKLWNLPEHSFLINQGDLIDCVHWHIDSEKRQTVRGRELRKRFSSWVFGRERVGEGS